MNYLELCQALIRECGISGLSSFSTTAGAVGEGARVTSWIAQAWNEIQTQHEDWGFLKSSYLNGAGAVFQTVNNVLVYPLGTGSGTVGVASDSFGKWDEMTLRNFTTSVSDKSDEIFLDYISYDDWRDAYMYGALRTVRTRPVAFAVAPDKSICLGPPSDGLYTVEADYWVAPQQFSIDGDVPQGLQTKYHMLIVYRAMMKYAGYESAPEVDARASREYGPLYRDLESTWAPRVLDGGALA